MKEQTQTRVHTRQHYLVASDFDKTLSFNDSGDILSEIVGVHDFQDRVLSLSNKNLVQQGGELAYLLVHDPAYREVRKEHLQQAGRGVRLKGNVDVFRRLLAQGIEDFQFSFYVISAAPEDVVQSALSGLVPPEHICGTRFEYDESGHIKSLVRVPAGYGKVAVLSEIQERLVVADDHVVYVGDGGSDVHVMLHVNRRDGFTISVSEVKSIAQIARRTVLSDDAMSVMVPILEELCGWNAMRIRAFFRSNELLIQEWSKVRTDWLTIRDSSTFVDGAVA